MDWKHYIATDPQVMHGSACFVQTRIPVSVVLDNLADGADLAAIRQQYPGLTAEHVSAALNYAAELSRERVIPLVV